MIRTVDARLSIGWAEKAPECGGSSAASDFFKLKSAAAINFLKCAHVAQGLLLRFHCSIVVVVVVVGIIVLCV